MTDRFQSLVEERRPQLVKNGEPEDDPARPDVYQAVRRIRSFRFADVLFKTHRGAAQAFPWAQLRGWVRDDAGRRLSFVWPEGVIVLTGRYFDQLDEDIMRRIVAEFRQVAPAEADQVPAGTPVILTMEVVPLEQAAGLTSAA